LEESVRVRVRVLEAFAQHGWSVAETPELAATLRAKLPAGFSLDPKGIPSRKA
jgi:hypothetical protein